VSPSPTGGTGSALLAILAGIVAALHVWKLAPALPELSADLGLSLVQGGFLLGIVQVAGMVLGVAVGLAGDRIGQRRSLLIGLFCLTAAAAVGMLAGAYWVLLATRLVEGVGFMLVSICVPGLIRRVAPAMKVALLLGLWGCHIPVAAALSLGLGGMLSGQVDWRVWWGAAAAASLVVAVMVLLRLPPDRPARPERRGLDRLRLTLGAGGPLRVALVFLLYTAQWNGIVQFLPTMYAESAVDPSTAAALSALVAGVNAFGNLGAGAALHRGVRPTALWCFGFTVMAASAGVAFGLAPLAHPDVQFAVRYSAILVFSAVGGLIPTTAIASLMRVAPTPAVVATAVGLGQQLNAAGQFVGPPLVAGVAQAAGTWDFTWVVTGVLAVLGIAVASRISRRAPTVLWSEGDPRRTPRWPVAPPAA
jgi:predicted MFS family arabinose efflux permease